MLPFLVLAILATVLCVWLVNHAASPTGAPRPVQPPWLPPTGQPSAPAPKRSFRMWLRDALYFGPKADCFANIGEPVTPSGLKSKYTDAAITTRYLMGKTGSDANHVAVTSAASDVPLGIITDEAAAAEDVVAVQLLGSAATATVRMVASEAIAADALVYTAASGKIQDAPGGGAGDVYLVGRARTAATGDGYVIEVESCLPVKVTF